MQNLCASHSSLHYLGFMSESLFSPKGLDGVVREAMMFVRLVFTPYCCTDLKALTQDKSNLPRI